MAAAKLSKILRRLRDEGVASVAARVRQKAFEWRQKIAYRRWLESNGTIDDHTRELMQREIRDMPSAPLLSIILPVYNIDEIWLRRCIDSVLAQIYSKWELCAADDHSTLPHVRQVLEEYARTDVRIKVSFREENGHISAASNSALEMASGEFVILLDHDDELTADALYWVAKELGAHPDCDMIYSDEDMIDTRGRRYAPKFKPDWSRDLFYSLNLITHLSAYRTELAREIGGFRLGFEGSQDYDLALRIIEKTTEDRIRHIPRILYHWRAIEGSVALDPGEKPYAHERARQAIREHLSRSGIDAEVSASEFNLHRVRYGADEPTSVLLIVFNTGGDSTADVWKSFVPNPNTTVLFSVSGSATELNELARSKKSDVLGFVDARVVPSEDEWLQELVQMTAGIGVVGGKVIDNSDRVVAGGILFGAGKAHVAFEGFLCDAAGMMGRNLFIGNYSAISIKCMALRRELFERAGGFGPALDDELAGIDLCLKVGRLGYRVILDPFVVMRIEQRQRWRRTSGSIELPAHLSASWPNVTDSDPFYSPNVDQLNGRFEIKV